MNVDNKYLTIKEACEFLKISRPTFDKIRKEHKLRQFWFRKRPRFLMEDIVRIGKPTPVANITPDPRVDLYVFPSGIAADLITTPHTYDLGKIRQYDPHGLLTLFSSIADETDKGHTVTLLVEDNFICNHLKELGFFQELEKKCGAEKIVWDREALKTSHTDFKYPVPLTNVRLRKEEAPYLERLIKLLRTQGFSEAFGGYVGWIYGELADNATTHLMQSSAVSDCHLLAQRFKFNSGPSECVIISIADIGPGIHGTLKRNPKYSNLSDKHAFLTAFKPNVSSWGDEHKRGKGLTDILTIAMGNKSYLRAESGQHVWTVDFRTGKNRLNVDPRLPSGTRISLVLIDHEFERKSYLEAEQFIDAALGGI